MLRSRTLSDTGNELFSTMNPFSPKNKNREFTKMNSWAEIDLSSPEPSPRRKSTGCINLKKFDLKKIYLDLMTTEFDKKLESNLKNMRNASKKLLSYLYNKDKVIPNYTNNAVSNLVILILSDGEKFLTKQRVKHNIHFYLKLAEKAMKQQDHQTAILIKLAMQNHNILRLNLKFKKNDQKILNELYYNYGGFKDCHGKHMQHFLDKYTYILKDWEKIGIDKEWIPSAMIVHMHTNRNKAYEKAFTRIGKYPAKLINQSDKIEKLKKHYYKAFLKDKGLLLTKLYNTDPNNLQITKDIYEKEGCKNISQVLFHLSCNVKKVKNNKSKNIEESKKKLNRLYYCK